MIFFFFSSIQGEDILRGDKRKTTHTQPAHTFRSHHGQDLRAAVTKEPGGGKIIDLVEEEEDQRKSWGRGERESCSRLVVSVVFFIVDESR